MCCSSLNSMWKQIRRMVELTWIAAVRSLVAKVFALDRPRSRKVPSTRLEKNISLFWFHDVKLCEILQINEKIQNNSSPSEENSTNGLRGKPRRLSSAEAFASLSSPSSASPSTPESPPTLVERRKISRPSSPLLLSTKFVLFSPDGLITA